MPGWSIAGRRADVRIGEPVVKAVDPVGQDVGGSQPGELARGRVGRKDRCDDVAQCCRMTGALREIGKTRVEGEVGTVEGAGGACELLFL
jgi:hypothetical protein